jgi:hypothetical protein
LLYLGIRFLQLSCQSKEVNTNTIEQAYQRQIFARGTAVKSPEALDLRRRGLETNGPTCLPFAGRALHHKIQMIV